MRMVSKLDAVFRKLRTPDFEVFDRLVIVVFGERAVVRDPRDYGVFDAERDNIDAHRFEVLHQGIVLHVCADHLFAAVA